MRKGTFIGCIAIVLWSFSALFLSFSLDMPPFLLLAIHTFSASFLCFFIRTLKKGFPNTIFRTPFPVQDLLFPFTCIFFYEIFYILAFKYAPPAEANLLNYLWPILLVLLSGLIAGQKINLYSAVGALVAFAGVVALNTGASGSLNSFQLGHLFAVLAAIIWATYSALNRARATNSFVNPVPTVLFFSSIVAILLHFIFEDAWSFNFTSLFFATFLGISSGMGVFLWDIATKTGDVQMLGVISYLTPLLSTFILTFFGSPILTDNIIISSIFIVCGVLIASQKDVIAIIKRSSSRCFQS